MSSSSVIPRFKTVLDANVAALPQSPPSLDEVLRVVSVDGVGKDGLFRMTARIVAWNSSKESFEYRPYEFVVPPQWLDKSGRKIQSELSKTLKIGACVYTTRYAGSGGITNKSNDRRCKDTVKNYLYLVVVLPPAMEAEWFTSGFLKETMISPESAAAEKARLATVSQKNK
jgi:hypothetical protein